MAASRSLAKCWLRPAVRAVSRVFTLPGSSEFHPPLPPSLLSPQAARLSRKPPASGLARRSPRAGSGRCGHGALRVLPLPEQCARPRPAARGASSGPRPNGDLGGGTDLRARDEAESRGRSPAAGSPRTGGSVCSSLFWSGPWALGGCSGCQNLASPTCYSWLGAYGRGSG